MNITELELRSRDDLVSQASNIGLAEAPKLQKQELVQKLLSHQAEQFGHIFGGGVLDIVDDGFGFLRGESLLPGINDVYVSQTQIRRFGLRTGDYVTGQV